MAAAPGAAAASASSEGEPSAFDKMRSLDFYPKTLDDFRVRTSQGALVSITTVVLMLLLFCSELSFFMTTERIDRLTVDDGHREKLSINFDVTFPSTPCALVAMSAMDPSGEHELSTDHEVYKTRLDAAGAPKGEKEKHNFGGTVKTKEDLHDTKKANDAQNGGTPNDGSKPEQPCQSCYGAGAKGECCNTCDEVKSAYARKGWKLPSLSMRNHITQCAHEGFEASLDQKGEGCNLHGHFLVPKVSGNFHFGPSKSFQHAHLYTFDLMSYTTEGFNISHTINSLTFGPPYPGRDSPLDDMTRLLSKEDGSGMFQYYCQIVPTQYNALGVAPADAIVSNQFAVTEHFRKINAASHRWLPGVFFFYDISSIKINRDESRKGLLQFLTSLCAIVGGVFTTMGLVDSSLHAMGKRKVAAGLG
jgi:endoplasmic reticulum-Golgi intermediate compartment protein 3